MKYALILISFIVSTSAIHSSICSSREGSIGDSIDLESSLGDWATTTAIQESPTATPLFCNKAQSDTSNIENLASIALLIFSKHPGVNVHLQNAEGDSIGDLVERSYEGDFRKIPKLEEMYEAWYQLQLKEPELPQAPAEKQTSASAAATYQLKLTVKSHILSDIATALTNPHLDINAHVDNQENTILHLVLQAICNLHPQTPASPATQAEIKAFADKIRSIMDRDPKATLYFFFDETGRPHVTSRPSEIPTGLSPSNT